MHKSLFWSFLEQGGAKVVTLVVQIVLARLLAPEAFGVLAIMLVVVEVANVLSQNGLGAALIQAERVGGTDVNTAFLLSFGMSLVLYLAIFAISPLVAAFYAMDGLEVYLRVLALAVPMNAVNSIQRSLLQKEMDFKSIFKSNMAAVVASGALGVALAFAGLGVWALVAQALSQALIACAVMLAYVPWRPSLAFDRRSARSLFSYGWKIMATGVLNVIYTGVSELILGKACSASDLGVYSQGRKWPNAGISVASNALQNVMFPAFAELQGEPDKLREAIRRALAAGTYVVAPLALFLAAAAEPLVVLLLAERWEASVPVFQLTCVGATVLIMQLVNLRAYMALGDSGLYLKLQIIKVIILCAVIWPTAIFTRDIYVTATAVTAAGIACVLFVDLVPAKRMHGVGALEQLSIAARIVAAAAVAAAAAWAVSLAPLPHGAALALQLTVFLPVYLAESRLFALPGSAECAQLFRKLLKAGS